MSLERSILQIIRGEKKAPLDHGRPGGIECVYRTLIAARNLGYDRDFFASDTTFRACDQRWQYCCRGNGKTPLVHLLASKLQEKARLAILTRGFRSQIEKSGESKQISWELAHYFHRRRMRG